MSYHILHLLSPNLRVRLKLDQLYITDGEKCAERTVPLADIAVVIVATPDVTVTAGALRRMAELNVLLLVCNEKFEPCALTLPYYRATDTELLRRQIEWSREWKLQMWRQIITAKVRNQAANLADLKRAHTILSEIANRCEAEGDSPNGIQRTDDGLIQRSATVPVAGLGVPPSPSDVARNAVGETPTAAGGDARAPQTADSEFSPSKISLATLTASKRAAFRSYTPEACESRAARHYWKHLLPRLAKDQHTGERLRTPGTREGVNGMLDYGYAIIRTAVLRSLAAHGFIAAIGIAHTPKASSFALADDLVEPLRPWIDRELRQFIEHGPRRMAEWVPRVVTVLQHEVIVNKSKVRLLNAIDLYVQSFATTALSRLPLPLKIPLLK